MKHSEMLIRILLVNWLWPFSTRNTKCRYMKIPEDFNEWNQENLEGLNQSGRLWCQMLKNC